MLQKPTSIKFVCFCFVWRYVSIFFHKAFLFCAITKRINQTKIEKLPENRAPLLLCTPQARVSRRDPPVALIDLMSTS